MIRTTTERVASAYI